MEMEKGYDLAPNVFSRRSRERALMDSLRKTLTLVTLSQV